MIDPKASRTALIAMTEQSPVMAALADGRVEAMLDAIEDVWVDDLHLDLHRAESPESVVVLQPGFGGHARCYFLLGALLARAGHHVLAIDRPGHGRSPGPRGDCTISCGLKASARTLTYAREHFDLPVILLGSSLGGMLATFAVLEGQRPDLVVAHNFLCPGKLASMRLRGRFIERFRQRPYRLSELVHNLKTMSADPGMRGYFASEADPHMVWHMPPRVVADLFRYRPPRPSGSEPPVVLLSGGSDPAIPAWASRLFLRWCGIRPMATHILPDCGHWLFSEHLDVALLVLLDVMRTAGQPAVREASSPAEAG